MRILHVTYADSGGGAARAAFRLHRAQRERGIESTMWVTKKGTADPHVREVGECFPGRNALALRIQDRLLRAMPAAEPRTDRSLNLVPSLLHRRINASNADVVHLHWINEEMISVGEVARIAKPVVWTVHDAWASGGTLHYPNGVIRPIERFALRRKQRHWQHTPFVIVSPSRWLANVYREHPIFRNRTIHVIPNPISCDEIQWQDRSAARRALGLADDRVTLLFGAHDVTLPRKGADLLARALERIAVDAAAAMELVIFGNGDALPPLPIPTRRAGWVERDLSAWYSAADILLLPSRIDNLPNTVAEAMRCGLPCVAFRTGGVPDLIEHRRTGYLAEPLDTDDFAAGIRWVLAEGGESMRQAVRERARMFDGDAIVPAYLDVYAQAVAAS